jgi:hypothetical protein
MRRRHNDRNACHRELTLPQVVRILTVTGSVQPPADFNPISQFDSRHWIRCGTTLIDDIFWPKFIAMASADGEPSGIAELINAH